jgi:hypothetical protein
VGVGEGGGEVEVEVEVPEGGDDIAIVVGDDVRPSSDVGSLRVLLLVGVVVMVPISVPVEFVVVPGSMPVEFVVVPVCEVRKLDELVLLATCRGRIIWSWLIVDLTVIVVVKQLDNHELELVVCPLEFTSSSNVAVRRPSSLSYNNCISSRVTFRFNMDRIIIA